MPRPPQTPTTRISRRTLAARWDCSISTIKRIQARGEITPIRIGLRHVRYDIEQIRRIEEQHSQTDRPQ